MKTIVHVNQHVIKANAVHDRNEAPLTVKDYKTNRYGHTAELWYNGEKLGEFVYRKDDPLSCGAKVWFQTDKLEVRIPENDS